jgi:DNA-binding beta-propeller fold protein YncE
MLSRKFAVCVAFLAALLVAGVTAQNPAQDRQGRDLLYVGVPGSVEPGHDSGVGILVFDVRDNFRFVKRITTFHRPASAPAGEFEVKGIAASPANNMLYLSHTNGLAAIDLTTEKIVWEENYEKTCCDRGQVSPDGKTLYMPAWGPQMMIQRNRWFVSDALTGKWITTIPTPGSIPSHNTVWSADGSRVYMAGSDSVAVADAKTHKIVQTIGPFSGRVKPYTVNGHGTLMFATVDENLGGRNLPKGRLLGFEVADLKTGKVMPEYRTEVKGFDIKTREVWGAHGQACHGIAMTPDEKEIWLTDSANEYLHVFDITTMPPKQKMGMDVKLRSKPYWITVGLDGKYIFPSTGDVIDAATKKVVAVLKDEYGRDVRSEKLMELYFSKGKLTRVANQFGVGMAGAPTSSTQP